MTEENKTNQGSTGGSFNAGIGSAAESKLDSSKTHARRAAEDLKSAATAVADEYRGKAEQAWDDARVRARTFQEDGEQYVRDNPTKAVCTALGIGFILGLVFRR